MKNPHLVLIRGLPGSGKTTLAKTKFWTYVHCEADQYFELFEYFDPKKLPTAHDYCQTKCRESLRVGFDTVVSNTFTQLWEMKPYLEMTDNVTVYRMTTMYKNVHNVPKKTIEKMRNRFENFDGEILI